MKAMLLAAGRGERMRPLTDHTAKPLIQVKQKALIEYHLHKLSSAGITEVIINTCWHADKIVEKIGSGSQYGLAVKYSYEPKALETAGGIANALTLLGDDPFLVISTDIWTDFEFTELSKPTDKLAHLILVDNPPHNPNGDFSLNKNNVERSTSGNLTYSGIGVFEPTMFEDLPKQRMPLREVLIPAINCNKVSGKKLSGNWFDIGTIDRLAQLEQFLDD